METGLGRRLRWRFSFCFYWLSSALFLLAVAGALLASCYVSAFLMQLVEDDFSLF
jgi:hypothetical protein